jgi:NDP-sugar pyrophosphorylase family protein
MTDLAVIIAISNSSHKSQLAYNRPRVMLPVLGKPMMIRTMQYLHQAGIKKYVVVVGENEGAIAAYLQKQWLPNVEIEFIIQPHNSSITHTLINIYQKYQSTFLITTYSHFTHPNFPETLLKRYNQIEPSLMLTGAQTSLSKSTPTLFAEHKNGWIKSISTKKTTNNHTNIGNLAICGHEFNQFLCNSTHITSSKQLIDIFLPYIQANQPTYLTETSWLLQIDTDYDLLTLNQQLLKNNQDAHILSEIPTSVQITSPVRIDPNVSIGKGAKIGPYVYLESGSNIGQNSTITNSIILENTTIPANTTVNNSIFANHIHITNPAML